VHPGNSASSVRHREVRDDGLAVIYVTVEAGWAKELFFPSCRLHPRSRRTRIASTSAADRNGDGSLPQHLERRRSVFYLRARGSEERFIEMQRDKSDCCFRKSSRERLRKRERKRESERTGDRSGSSVRTHRSNRWPIAGQSPCISHNVVSLLARLRWSSAIGWPVQPGWKPGGIWRAAKMALSTLD